MRLTTKKWIGGFVTGCILTGIVAGLMMSERSYQIVNSSRPITEPHQELIVGEITAYTSSIEETDDKPTIMADGREVFDGAVACPSRYAFGTIIKIDGTPYECADRMHRRYRDGDYFDIWVIDKQVARNWGRRIMLVEIIGVKN